MAFGLPLYPHHRKYAKYNIYAGKEAYWQRDYLMALEITAKEIEKWSDKGESQNLLPVLVRRLMYETLGVGKFNRVLIDGKNCANLSPCGMFCVMVVQL